MSDYYRNLERKIRELERESEEAHKKSLKLQDLTHKANIQREFASLYKEYYNEKEKLEKQIADAENLLYDLDMKIEDKKEAVWNMKRLVDDFYDARRRAKEVLRNKKSEVNNTYRKKQESIRRLAVELESIIRRGQQSKDLVYYSIFLKSHKVAKICQERIAQLDPRIKRIDERVTLDNPLSRTKTLIGNEYNKIKGKGAI